MAAESDIARPVPALIEVPPEPRVCEEIRARPSGQKDGVHSQKTTFAGNLTCILRAKDI
jgi:hypothetical protein